MPATDTAYAAGVIDSDGTIGITRGRQKEMQSYRYRPRVVVKQVTPEAVDLLQALWPANRSITKPQAPTRRPLHTWAITGHPAGRALQDLLPHLRIKHAHAENVIELCALMRTISAPSHTVPEVAAGEPLVSLPEAAEQLGLTLERAYSSVRRGTIPVVRVPRAGQPKHSPTIFVPESFIEIWRTRGRPQRDPSATDALHEHYERAKELNAVGVVSP